MTALLDRPLAYHSTFERPPRAEDADGNGNVLAFLHGTWCSENWKSVAYRPMSAPFWMPMSALPHPGEQE